MGNQKIQSANKPIRRVTYASLAVNVALSAVKIAAGLATGSMSLVADGVHSVSDMATDAAVLLGVYFGSKEPDPEHPYGHGWIETFAAVFVAVVLVLVGGVLIQRASLAIVAVRANENETADMSMGVFWVAMLSIVAKEGLYRVTRLVAVRTHSTALYANAWHHRSDALSSVAVVIGFASARFGYAYADQIAAIAVGLMIILVAVKIMGGCLEELTERSVDAGTIEQIRKIIASQQRIRQYHKLRTRSVGREVFLDLHILVDPQLSITDAHEISESLEEAMHTQLVRPVNVTVHIEPDRPELRK
ncbi:MAG: cation transporter [Planctomycetes bacterium]|nr:cation transporter [Planctomycetota bacterium]